MKSNSTDFQRSQKRKVILQVKSNSTDFQKSKKRKVILQKKSNSTNETYFYRFPDARMKSNSAVPAREMFQV